MASIVSCRFLLCFNISPSFFPRTSSPPASCHFPSASLLTTQAFAFHSSACLSSLFFLFFSPLRSFYLTHTVIVKPRVQMLRSVPPSFSMWSCEKTREPRLECIGRFFARPRVCTHNTEPLDTNTLEEHFFCSFFFFFWPTFIWHVAPLMVLVELNWGQSVGTASGVRMGVKSIKVIWQTFYIAAFVTLSAGLSRRLPLISTSGRFFSLLWLPLPPCGGGMAVHLWALSTVVWWELLCLDLQVLLQSCCCCCNDSKGKTGLRAANTPGYAIIQYDKGAVCENWPPHEFIQQNREHRNAVN